MNTSACPTTTGDMPKTMNSDENVKFSGVNEQFASAGYLGPCRLLTSEIAAAYASELREFVEQYQADGRFRQWTYLKSHLLLDWVARLACEPTILEVVGALLGPNIVLWDSFIPVKRPRSVGHFHWHQDATYWSVGPLGRIVTLWLALGPVTAKHGPMKFLPGSHVHGQLEHEKTYDPNSMLRRGQRVCQDIDETIARLMTLEPGEATIHHPYLIHGSGPNETDEWRWGAALVYVSGEVRAKPGHIESGVLLRGTSSGLDHEQPAIANLGPAELAEYERVTQRSAGRYEDITMHSTRQASSIHNN